jgi:hypothetical protein
MHGGEFDLNIKLTVEPQDRTNKRDLFAAAVAKERASSKWHDTADLILSDVDHMIGYLERLNDSEFAEMVSKEPMDEEIFESITEPLSPWDDLKNVFSGFLPALGFK